MSNDTSQYDQAITLLKQAHDTCQSDSETAECYKMGCGGAIEVLEALKKLQLMQAETLKLTLEEILKEYL